MPCVKLTRARIQDLQTGLLLADVTDRLVTGFTPFSAVNMKIPGKKTREFLSEPVKATWRFLVLVKCMR